MKDLNAQYNNALRQQFTFSRNYTQGNIWATGTQNVPLFGKPSQLERDINKVFKDFVDDIDNNTEGYIKYLEDEVRFFSNKTIRNIKRNYKEFVENYRSSYQNGATTILQSLTDIQTSFIQTLSRANVVPYPGTVVTTGTDGYQRTNGDVTVFDISGTTQISASSAGVTNTLEEIIADIEIVASAMTQFNDTIQSQYVANVNGQTLTGYFAYEPALQDNIKTIVFQPFTEETFFDPQSNRRQYFILAQEIIDENKYNSFKNALIGNLQNNEGVLGNVTFDQVEQTFDTYWKGTARPAYVAENQATATFLNDFESNALRNYLIFTPYNLNKERVLTYERLLQPSAEQIQLIKNLGNKNNIDTNTKNWNTGLGNVYIGKAQLL